VNKKVPPTDWFLRFCKGALIGTGFILPGVSGGALAAVFGLYERIITFLAHPTRNFVRNLVFFIPVGLGGLLGMALLSRPLSFFLENYEVPVLWFFIGAIMGTLPELWSEAGKKGRTIRHVAVLILTFALALVFLLRAEKLFAGQVSLNTGMWVAAGVLIALGALVPGMSPSNFLVYLGMYKPMVTAFKTLDVTVLLPIGGGCALCLAAFSKVMDLLFTRVYAGLFHFILGIVLASTVVIVPVEYNYLQSGTILCVLTLAAGTGLSYRMTRLDARDSTLTH
jgi:putative membrane protein